MDFYVRSRKKHFHRKEGRKEYDRVLKRKLTQQRRLNTSYPRPPRPEFCNRTRTNDEKNCIHSFIHSLLWVASLKHGSKGERKTDSEREKERKTELPAHSWDGHP
uniref:Uncharacterized protein n=1 Tax=Odontella aurita TaxID=265563 RepID=A0A7S4K458_9STRA|mmetsp:Transcript_61117/g.180779  ORF Transcript_61117/g.180779 Transcript_61117/m.180779 type:complete len:105 (+) Transcript_61117:306-620(+)